MEGWIGRLFRLLVIWVLGPGLTYGIGDTHLCSSPLGMEGREIPDSALTGSSYYVHSVGPHQARLNTEDKGGAWCPKEPIAYGVREWLQVSLNGTHLVSGVQVQGRYARGKGQEYTEEYELEYWRAGFRDWRKYYKFDGKTVLPGNSDTSSVVTNKLRPPLLASKIRLLPYSAHRRTVCLRVELLGCPFKDGVVEYRMAQGDSFLEGISLRDESYDGAGSKWDRRVDPGLQPQSTPPDPVNSDPEEEGGGQAEPEDSFQLSPRGPGRDPSAPSLLSAGLGQLTDKIEGGPAFTMDLGFGLGNGWVGWKRRSDKEDFVELLVEFDRVRAFSSLDLFTNNYPSKGVQICSEVRVHFSIGGLHYNGRGVRQVLGGTDVTLEHARNLSLALEGRIGRFLKVQLYYRAPWIVLGELYFHSEIYEGNFTEELGPDAQPDFPDTQSPLEIRDLDSSMVETVVGILSGLILLLGVGGGLILWMRRNGRAFPSAIHFNPSSAFPFWRSTPWNAVPTHIVAQGNPATEGVKDLLLTLTPLSNGIGNGGNPPPAPHLDFKAPNPPPYANGTKIPGPANGLQLQGSHHNQYGSTKTVVESGGTRTTTLTLRSNHLARLDDEEDEDETGNNIYTEASTLSATTATSRTRNRKIKVAGSVWSLSSGGRAYRNHPGRLVPEVSLRQLRLIENLGSCLFGQVHLYDFEGEIACHEGTLYRNCRVIAKTIKSVSEVRLLSVLDHEHVLEMIGVCNEMKSPRLAIFPAPECGDLCSFLSRLTNTPSLAWLLSVGAQIASGMNYLESLSLIHRDLAARNCLVEREGSIRISDLAMACEQYHGDYCHTSAGLAPLRWWSWESVLTDDFTMQSSVWSFGVTLWEILTLCRQKPLVHVPDHQLVTLAEKYGSTATSSQVWLPQPVLSPPEIFDLMIECWQKSPEDRPTFQNIHLFLEQKCNGTVYHAV